MSTYAERQAYRDAHPGVIVDATSAYDPKSGQTSNPFSGGGGGSSPAPPAPFDPQASTAALNAAGYRDDPAGRAASAAKQPLPLAPPGTGLTNPMNGQPWSFADLQAYFAQTSGMSQKDLDEKKRQFDADLAQKIAQMQAIGIPELEIKRRAQDLADRNFEEQLKLAQTAQQAQLSGLQANGQPTETAREFNASNSMAQGRLGLDYTNAAATFAASNPFQLSDFMRGAAQNPGVPRYLQNLQNNVVQGSGATVGPNPAPAIRLGDVASNLAGGGAGYSQTNPAQQAIGGIYQRGANALAPGTLESLTPDELTNLQQGINQGYGSAAGPAFLQSYRNNPVRSQTAATTGYMAA